VTAITLLSILATATAAVAPLQRATRTVPIVFVNVIDPVGAGFVASLARPGGNATGFMPFEYSISGKWLELLKQILPGVTRAVVLRDPAVASRDRAVRRHPGRGADIGHRGAPGRRARCRRDRARHYGLRAHLQERADRNGSVTAIVHRELIVTLAARHSLPAVYPYRYHITAGGLIAYGPDTTDPYRRAAVYVDRIFKGEKPGDLPVQAPTKYDLIINLKTAKALGLEIPPTLLARADEVIE